MKRAIGFQIRTLPKDCELRAAELRVRLFHVVMACIYASAGGYALFYAWRLMATFGVEIGTALR